MERTFRPYAGYLHRELMKAYTAFCSHCYRNTREPYSFVTTGLWGCGAFGGNRQVKAIIQWYAAPLANVLELRYVLGGEEQKVFRDVFDVLVRLGTDLQNGKAAVPKPDEIFEYVLQSL
ncbi:MAG: hypothetical protein LBE67_00040 [Kocuria palustris]|nr:hypothetical protein [Kocuria palustris]